MESSDEGARMFAPGWHRKWLLLLAALAALFLSRFRLMGWLVSKLLTLQLAKHEPALRIDVRVRLVLLQPLQLVHVEIQSDDDWTLLVTRIAVHSRVGEFFRSFGQTKIWELEVDEVIGELHRLDEPLVRELLRRRKERGCEPKTAAPKEATNPLGFLRFVDFRVAAIELKLRCFGVSSEFRCRDLSIGITDVLVKENLLHAKLQVASVYARSFRPEIGAQVDGDVICDGVYLDWPSVCVVADLRLTDQKLVGLKLFGAKDELVCAQVCTSFLKFAMATQLELIQRGLLPSPTSTHPPSPTASKTSTRHDGVLAKEISHTNVSLIVIHEFGDHGRAPLKFAAEITSLSASKAELAPATPLDFEEELEAVSELTGVCLRSLVGSISVTTGREFQHTIEWDVNAKILAWTARAVVKTTLGVAEVLDASGGNTIVNTKLLHPVPSCQKRFDVRVESISADFSTTIATERQMHSAVFHGAELTLVKDRCPDGASVTSTIDAKFQSALVNCPGDGDVTRPVRFPAASMKEVSVRRHDKRAQDAVDSDMTLSLADARIEWSHRTHAGFLKEWAAFIAFVDRVDELVSPPKSTPGAPSPRASMSLASKTVSLDVRSKVTVVQLHDIRDVASQVIVRLADTKAMHQKQRLAVHTTFECALVGLLWDPQSPAMELASVKVQQKVLLGPQRLLAKVPVQSSIRAARMKVFMYPERRLLLLLLRFDELASAKDDADGVVSASEKKAARQGVSFDCAELLIEVHEKHGAIQDADTDDEVFYATMNALEIKSVVAKSSEMSDSMARFVQSLEQRESARDLDASVQLVEQILGVDGSITADSVALLRFKTPLASFRHLEIQFAMTDIVRAATERGGGSPSPKLTLFDFSGLARGCEISYDKTNMAKLARVFPVVQETFDTREKSEDSEREGALDWKSRYAGNVDVGVQQLAVVVPYGDDTATILDFECAGLGERALCVTIADFALNFRQFQKLAVQLSALRVFLGGGGDSAAKLMAEPQLQLLHVPQLILDATVHWTDKTLPAKGSRNAPAQEFALSFELQLKNKSTPSAVARVPAPEEALVALNWDYVFPLLVFFLTDDDEDLATSAVVDSGGDHGDAAAGLSCVGVQWDVSLDVVQVAFWDAMTTDVGLLFVTNDLLSHGVAKKAPQANTRGEDVAPSAWGVQEATTFVDQSRAYVLRNSIASDDYGEAATVERELLPFDSTKASNFIFEAIGTSYREIRGADTDDAQGSDLELLFSTGAAPLPERLHDSFMPIDFVFSLFGSTKLRTANSLAPHSALSIAIPPATATTPPAAPPASKSPRPWAQSVRSKLLRLKRRSSSMDNLLLNDGSCPIQVDAMKLLWTIETRDTVFYMTALTVDSLQRLAEATSEGLQPPASQLQSARTPIPGAPKVHDWRSPSPSSEVAHESHSSVSPDRLRRGSTRDTLLDLLQQGKLGMKHTSAVEETGGGAQASSEENEPRLSSGFGEAEEMNAAKAIARKQYTLDVHDAQINLREEGSRSSVLVATKHIHLELGLDDLRAHTVAHLKFDSVTAHVAPIDVDISAGVLWYAQSAASPAPSLRAQQAASSCLLQQVLDECSLTTTYSQALATGATAVEVDLSSLQLSTDRHQFYQLLSVVRHVLLAPPTIVRKQRQQPTRSGPPDLLEHEASDIAVFPPSPSPSLSAKKLHAQVAEELRSRETKQLHARVSVIPLKCISFRAEGTRFRLRLSPELAGGDHEFVEIRAEGVAGSHTYFSNQCTKLALHLQWLEVSNLRPGPSSIAFDDAMAVLKARLLVDKRLQGSRGGCSLATQKGMLTVRAESGPLIRVLGQKLRVLDVLEVSVFPEVANVIVIQLAADFYELVYKFFFESIGSAEHHQDGGSEHVLFGRRVGGHLSPSVARPVRGAAPSTPHSPASGTHPRRKSVQLSSASSTGGLAVDPNTSFVSSTASASSSAASSSASSSTAAAAALEGGGGGALEEDDASSADGCELFYFKYVRVGNVRLRINCHGFFVNLSDFDLELPPYVCQSKLCTWKKLLLKFESHLKWFVTKESASSGLSHFKNKFLKWTPAASAGAAGDKSGKSRKDEDASTINAQVLFGPYSGSAT